MAETAIDWNLARLSLHRRQKALAGEIDAISGVYKRSRRASA
jgi:hypothetical protein